MTQNRRFPFQRTAGDISLEGFSTTEQQLYPVIRQYTSVNGQNNKEKRVRHLQQQTIDNEENDRLNEFIHDLKQNHDSNIVDRNNFSALRDHNIQHWKDVKSRWQKYYHNEMKKQQEIFDNLIKVSRK